MAKQRVDFFFSPASRYSYLAASQIPALERAHDCVVTWRPVHGGDIRALRGRDPFAGAPLSGQYEQSYRHADASAWAQLYGISFHEPRGEFDFRLTARAAIVGARLGRAAEYSWELTSDIWARGRWPIDVALCFDVAERVGISHAAFSDALDSVDGEKALEAAAREAFDRGAFGVPTFFVGGRMFWGNDRLPLVRHALSQR